MASGAGANIVSTLSGLFKEVYADKLENLIPDQVILVKDLPMLKKEKTLGNLFHQPVLVQREHGFTYGGTAGDAYALNDAINGATKDAQVNGYSFVLRSSIGYDALSRSVSDKAAFEQATKLVVGNMVDSFAHRLECIMWYGQSSLGAVSTATEVSSDTEVVLSAASFAPGVWSGSVGAKLYITTANGQTARNSGNAVTVKAVDLDGRKITLEEVSLSLVATDVIWFSGSYTAGAPGTFKEFLGVNAIATASTLQGALTSLFNISPTIYADLWKSVEYDAGSAALSQAKIQKAMALAMAKGMKGPVKLYVNPKTWENLMGEIMDVRQFDTSYNKKEADVGHQSIKIYTQVGETEIIPCVFVKEADAFVISKDALAKIGSSEPTFKLPGYPGLDKFFMELPDNAGFQLRMYADLSLFSHMPAKGLLKIKNIVNS